MSSNAPPPQNLVNSIVLFLFFASIGVALRLLVTPITPQTQISPNGTVVFPDSISLQQFQKHMKPLNTKLSQVQEQINKLSKGGQVDSKSLEKLLKPIQDELKQVEKLATTPVDIKPIISGVLAAIGDKINIDDTEIQTDHLVYDFASSYLGATIHFPGTSESYFNSSNARLLGRLLPGTEPQTSPNTIVLDRGPMAPGKCWAFPGSRGYLEIHFACPISLDSWSISHVPLPRSLYSIAKRSVGVQKESAPNDINLFAISEQNSQPIPLGSFKFDKIASSTPTGRGITQRFPVKSKDLVSGILLEITSNHGSPDFTCISRIEAFGLLPADK